MLESFAKKYFTNLTILNFLPPNRYFSQIDESLLTQILEIYQLDFDLFDYDSSKYWKLVRKSEAVKVSNDIDDRVDFEQKRESKVFS